MDHRDLIVLAALEEGLPLVSDPFREIGRKIGMTEAEVLEQVTWLRDAGIIRRFRARINQRQIGITANALVAWCCDGKDSIEAGDRLGSFSGVTHCYERLPVPGRWEYRLYTVHHGRSRDDVQNEVRQIARATGLPDYCILFSTDEFKRVPNIRVRENGGGSR
jgi:DNA-binding Lrp family transcriptional regulator